MVYDIMNDGQRKVYEEKLECDFSFEIPNLARFRVNAFNQNRGAGAVFRIIPVEGALARGAERAEDLRRDRQAAARPGAGHRPHGLGQVDHARGDGELRQRERVRPHPHGRGPDRVRARGEEVPHQPARGRPAHAVVLQRAAQRAARGPGHHPGGRDARPGDDPPRDDRRRNGPPGVRHAAHDLGRQDHRPHHRRVPRGGEGDDPRDAVGIAARGDLADALQDQGRHRPRRGARDHDRHAGDPQPDPRGQGRADVFGDPDRRRARHADARPEPARPGEAQPRSPSRKRAPKAANKDNFVG